jgi:hypothetical protein
MSDLPKHPTAQLEGLHWRDRSLDGFLNWWLLDADGEIIAEAFQRDGEVKWHCKTSDWRDFAPDMETAKLRCVVSHVSCLYQEWADASVKARTARHGITHAPPSYEAAPGNVTAGNFKPVRD